MILMGVTGMSEVSTVDFDALRLQGVYRQQPKGDWVFVRFRVPLGRINADQLEALAKGARVEGKGRVHLTTRQAVEVHWVHVDRVEAIRTSLAQAGLYSQGSGGNAVRSIVTHYEGGPLAAEVEALGHFLSARLGGNPDFMNLPKKFKMAVAESHRGGALVNDLGLLPVKRGRGLRWQVYVGGGLGKEPKLAKLLPVEAPTDRVYGLVLAVLEVFRSHGEPKKRLKHTIQRLGFPRFWALVEGVWDKKADGPKEIAVIAQGESAHIIVPKGDMTSEQLAGVARLARRFSDGTVYLTQRQNLLFRGLTPEAKKSLLLESRELGLEGDDALDVVACPGKALCPRALVDTHLEEDIQRRFNGKPRLLEGLKELKINIAGCPNSCPQTQIYDVGLVGVVRKGANEPFGIQVFVGGGLDGPVPGFGEPLGDALAPSQVPEALEDLVEGWLRHRIGREDFRTTYLRLGTDAFQISILNRATV